MEENLSLRVLAVRNICRKPFRSFALAALVAVSAAVLFAVFLLSASLRKGIAGMQDRIGADLMVVPEGYGQNQEGVLLSGKPSYFYMDKSVEDTIRAMDGVREVTGQFYLTSLSESCCDFPVQIIGFDPESDFLIKPWVRQYETDGRGRAFFAGSNVNVKDGCISFFAKKHAVGAKLAKSGTGMDNSVFTDLAGIEEIFGDAKEKGFSFLSDGDAATKTSAIYVRLEDGIKADTAALKIWQAVSGVQVIQQGKFLRTFADKMDSIVFFLCLLAALCLLLTVLALALTFSLTMYERRREFSILRVLGASRPQLASVMEKSMQAIRQEGMSAGCTLRMRLG